MCDEWMLSYREAHVGRIVEPTVAGKPASTQAALDEVKKLFVGVPKDSIAFLLHARYSLEDNWALRELAMVLVGSHNVYASGRPDGYADDILIHKDKNPNSAGVRQLAPGARSFQDLLSDVSAGRVTHLVSLGGSAPADAEGLRNAKIVAISAHEGPLTKLASVVLPATSWAEHSGTYVNAKGMRQIAEKALEPQGSSKPAWKQVADVATAMGYSPSWSKLKGLRAELIGTAAADSASGPALPTVGNASAE